jgi:hypothetical protein
MKVSQNFMDVIDGEPQRVLGSEVMGDLSRFRLLPER